MSDNHITMFHDHNWGVTGDGCFDKNRKYFIIYNDPYKVNLVRLEHKFALKAG